jgi:hypothetical protein
MSMESYHKEIVYGKQYVYLILCLIRLYTMKTTEREEVQVHAFLMSALHGGEASTLRLSRFIPREETLCTTKWRNSWAQQRVGRFGKGNILLYLERIEPLPTVARLEA